MRLRPLSEDERLSWLRLMRTDGIGPITFRGLLQRFGTASAALEALPEMARRGGRARPLAIRSLRDAQRELTTLERLGCHLIGACEPGYPRPLAAVEDSPPLIVVAGDPEWLSRPCVAIVGARNASLGGRRYAEQIARDLGKAGLVVVSGLARGIDTAAHRGAIDTGTVAVVAAGVDVVYPPENAALQSDIVARGAVASEHAPGTEPLARHFPRRNRLIAGLSMGVVVVEAAPRSGSLITARLAAEQGREVLAVPGSPLDPRARGCNTLIRNGATLIQDASDVLEAISGSLRLPADGEDAGIAGDDTGQDGSEMPDDARRAVLDRLSPTPTTVDELVRDCQVSAAFVMTVLLELELAGRIERQAGSRIRLI